MIVWSLYVGIWIGGILIGIGIGVWMGKKPGLFYTDPREIELMKVRSEWLADRLKELDKLRLADDPHAKALFVKYGKCCAESGKGQCEQ